MGGWDDPLRDIVLLVIEGAIGTSSGGEAWTPEGSGDEYWDPMCCVAGTLILTDSGYLPIEKITQDSLVCGWNYMADDLKEPSFYPVTETFASNTPKKILTLTTSTGKSLTCSMSHPIWLPEYGSFVPASKIDIGEHLMLYGASLEDIYYDQVIEINYLLDDQFVYNFTVKEAHTYTANGILCHNIGGGGAGGARDPRLKYIPGADGPRTPTGTGGTGSTPGLVATSTEMGVEWMYGPSVSWASSPLEGEDSSSTPWSEASEYPEGDYTGITLRGADSSLRDGSLERIDPLTAYGMNQNTPEIVAMFDLYATELDLQDTYGSSAESGTAYENAHDVLFSNGPSKLLRMQIMSGIFLRANINSLFAVFKVQDISGPIPFHETNWLTVPASFFSLICYVDSVRNQASRLFTAYAAQTSRNMYIRQALQMTKSLKVRSLSQPASYGGANFNILRGDAANINNGMMGSVALDYGMDFSYGMPSGLDPLGAYRINSLQSSEYADQQVAGIAASYDGNSLPSLFEKLKLPNRFKQLSETGVFIQLLQELRRMIADGSYHMTGDTTGSGTQVRAIDSVNGQKFNILDDSSVSQTTAFVDTVSQADQYLSIGYQNYGSSGGTKLGTAGFTGAPSGMLIGGIVPRTTDSDGNTILGEISSDSLNYRQFGTTLINNIIENLPQGYEDAHTNNHSEIITYLCHFMNREFILSRRWKLDIAATATSGPVYEAKKFNSSIDNTTSLSDVLDQVIGDSVGSITNNGRDIDSFAASLNPEITTSVGGGDPGGRRMLPFEITDEENYISGYSTYINDLADSFINRDSTSSSLKSDSLANWATEFGIKQENLSNFVRNLLMIGHVNDASTISAGSITVQTTIVSNHMFLKACCQSLCQFVYRSNSTLFKSDSQRLTKLGTSEKYPSPAGFVPRRYEQAIQLNIVKVCMANQPGGFNLLETYLRYRREALQIRNSGDYAGSPKWPDFGDFTDGAGAASRSGVAAIGTNKEFGGGYIGEGDEVSPDESVEDTLEDGESTTLGSSTRLLIDDATYWWEDYYAAFAFAYPRFTEAASNLAYFYIENRLAREYAINDAGGSRCATLYSKIDSVGQSTTRYGLMQTPIGAALIEGEGESYTGVFQSLFDRMISTWDLYVESIFTMASDIESTADHGSSGNQFNKDEFLQSSLSRYTADENTWYRNLSLDTCRMLTYYTLGLLIQNYVGRRSLASIRIDGVGGNLSEFSTTDSVDNDTGRVWDSLLEGDYVTTDSDGSYIAHSGEDRADGWRWEDEVMNVSDDSPFDFSFRLKYDAVEAPSFLMSCLETFGDSFAKQVHSSLELSNGSAYGSGGYANYIDSMNHHWSALEGLVDTFGATIDSGNFSLTDQNNEGWMDSDNWSQSFTDIPGIAQCLVNEDLMIIRSLNAFSHVKDILNNRTALGGGIGTKTPETGVNHILEKSEEYVSYLRKYAFHTDSPTQGSIDLDDDENARLTVKSIFNGMNPDAVASAYAILCDNFTLSTAYINNLGSLPTPFQGIKDVSFDDAGATKSYTHLIPASETISEANYAAIRWFQSGPKNTDLKETDQTSGDLGINKKIIVAGIPTGMLENLREKARIDELTYREDAFSTSNFAHSSLIRIRVIKKSHDNPDIVFTPRTFYFDTKYYYTDSGTQLHPITLLRDHSVDDDISDINTIQDLTPAHGAEGIENLLGVYAKAMDHEDITGNETLNTIRSKLPGDLATPVENLKTKMKKMGLEKRPQDYGSLGLTNLVDPKPGIQAYKDFNDSGIKLSRFELSANADINSSRNTFTYEFDYDIDTHHPGEVATYIESAYRDAIIGLGSGITISASDDPTLDFLGLEDSSGDIGESVDGLYHDPWAYDQRSGLHFQEAFDGMAAPTGRMFGYQAAFNEVYSGILKHYIRMMTGFNVSERCFLLENAYGAPMVQSPYSLFTQHQNDYLSEYRPNDVYNSTNLNSKEIPGVASGESSVAGTSGVDEAAINAAKLSVINQATNYLRTAGSAISNIESQSLLTMMYKTFPISADKFRNQGLLPKKFDRVFCIAIDPEADFTPHYATTTGGSEVESESWLGQAADGFAADLEDATVTGIGKDGLLYSFLVDVAIIPMDADDSQARAIASGESIIA